MNETIKSKVQAKNTPYKKDIRNGKFESDVVSFQNLIIELNKLNSSTNAL